MTALKGPEGFWVRHQVLNGDLSNDEEYFGERLSMEGQWLVVSAKNYRGADVGTGAVYVFKLGAGEQWVRHQILEADFPQQYDWFGEDVEIQNRRILSGSRYQLGDGRGCSSSL